MGKTGQLPGQVASADELLAVAHALEQEAAARYRALSAEMLRFGNTAMAAQFEQLAGYEDRHAADVAGRSRSLLGRPPDPGRIRWDRPPADNVDAPPGATGSLYQALAFAVRNEERAFAFYTYLAAEAE